MMTPHGSFATHANYLRAFARLAGADRPGVNTAVALSATAAAARASPSLTHLQARACDVAQLRRSLGNAWGTELQLAQLGATSREEALVRLANNWAVVFVYYVLYHATQAFYVARGNTRAAHHDTTQRIYANTWADREVSLLPWALAAGAGGYQNVPTGRTIDERLHAWSACTATSCLDIAAKALRTTREQVVGEALRDARGEKAKGSKRACHADEAARRSAGRKARIEPRWPLPQLKPGEREAVTERTRSHTVFDYLWRLRIRTNYGDPSMFTEGPVDEARSAEVYADLVHLAASAMLVHELHIQRAVGARTFLALVDGWLATNAPSGRALGLARRRALLAG